MKLLQFVFMLAITLFVIGCGPGGPPPVVEPESADSAADVDVDLEKGLEAQGE